jgi:hypothetical protein
MSYADGSSYSGEWKANKKSGQGVYKKVAVVQMQTPIPPLPSRPVKKHSEPINFWVSRIQN